MRGMMQKRASAAAGVRVRVRACVRVLGAGASVKDRVVRDEAA